MISLEAPKPPVASKTALALIVLTPSSVSTSTPLTLPFLSCNNLVTLAPVKISTPAFLTWLVKREVK